VPGLSRAELAARAGVDVSYVDELIGAKILRPSADDRFTPGDVRRIRLLQSFQEAGLPLDGMAAGFDRGILSLDFVDQAEYERFATLTDETFEQVSERTNVPVSLLALIREATGLGAALPGDRLREDELQVVPFLQIQVQLGFDPVAIERLLRAMGDSTRKIAEAEAEWWRSQVSQPRLEAGQSGEQVGNPEGSMALSRASTEAMLAIYRAQQAQTWTSNILGGFEYILANAGLYKAPDRAPAICFLDITGYTRLTQERGDAAAAELAERLARLVKRTSTAHGGRPVKWLGDGVMFWFRDPGPGVVAALEMLDGLVAAGLPPAHVGLHSGPVIMQEGDFYGQTVNMASRIAEYARPGEVLVSQAIVDATDGQADGLAVAFTDIGAVELKGVSGATQLHAARRAT
jgi:adenylate cyclase